MMTMLKLNPCYFFRFFLSVFLIVGATPARSDWMLVDANEDASILVSLSDYLATSPIKELTFLMNFNEPVSGIGYEFNSAVQMAEFDCASMNLRILGFKNFKEPMGQGVVTFKHDKPTAWKQVRVDSMEYSIWKVACE
jgi:hypothetical protein